MNYLLKALILMILLSISYSELREEVIDRHENGKKKKKMVYKNGALVKEKEY